MCGFLNPHLGLGTSGIQCCGLNTNSPFQYITGASVYWNWESVVVVEVRGLFGLEDQKKNMTRDGCGEILVKGVG